MAAFLWSQNGQNRVHWVAWRKVCRPLSAGGLGIRSLGDTISGPHGKLAWKILAHDTLWTRMLLQKYGKDSVYNGNSRFSNSSRLWKTIYPHFQRLINVSQWQVGRGEMSFWGSNWCGEVLSLGMNAALTVQEGLHQIDNLKHELSEE